MVIVVALGCVAVLLGVACLAVAAAARASRSPIVYGACLLVSLVGLGAGLVGAARRRDAAPRR